MLHMTCNSILVTMFINIFLNIYFKYKLKKNYYFKLFLFLNIEWIYIYKVFIYSIYKYKRET